MTGIERILSLFAASPAHRGPVPAAPVAAADRVVMDPARGEARTGPPAADDEDARAGRAFVQDLTARNPDAFASDLDVQAMMQLFPGRF